MNYKWGNRSKERMKGVNDILVECATRALSICRADMTIPKYGGVRTPGEQKSLYDKGYSQRDGYEKRSYHQTGNALDVIPVKGGYSNASGFREFARCMFYTWQLMIKEEKIPKDLCLFWGGHWRSFVDTPHWELRKI